MLFVTDTSTLIVLRKLEWLDLCISGDVEIIWPQLVTQELREQKRKNQKILALLASHQAEEVEVHKHITLSGISQTDAEVISLASELNAAVLSEDKLLRQKAERLAISTFSISTLVRRLYQIGTFSQQECLLRLSILHRKFFCLLRSITSFYWE